MRLLVVAAGVMLAALAMLFAMVVGLTEPSLVVSLTAYGTICGGMILGVAGARRHGRGRR